MTGYLIAAAIGAVAKTLPADPGLRRSRAQGVVVAVGAGRRMIGRYTSIGFAIAVALLLWLAQVPVRAFL